MVIEISESDMFRWREARQAQGLGDSSWEAESEFRRAIDYEIDSEVERGDEAKARDEPE